MTDQAPSKAITPYNKFRDLLKTENVTERFQALLRDRAPEFLASLLSLVSADRSLLDCDPATILASAAKAAILRLPIAKELGYAYIVPFKREATFILGYKGMIQLAIRTAQYHAINAAEIYQGEEVKVDRLTGNVKLNGNRTGNDVIGYVAYFKLRNGFEKFLYMSRDETEAYATRYSKSWGNPKSAWTTNFDEMGKKTVLRRLLSKYGLMSIEMQDTDEKIPALESDPRLTEMPNFDDVVDGTLTDPEAEPPAPPETNQTVDLTAEIITKAIEAGYTENEHSARQTLKYCKVQFASVEDGLTWFKSYRGWRDMDAKPAKAAEYANNGEMPH